MQWGQRCNKNNGTMQWNEDNMLVRCARSVFVPPFRNVITRKI